MLVSTLYHWLPIGLFEVIVIESALVNSIYGAWGVKCTGIG